MEDSVITDEMHRQIGMLSEPWIVEVERGAIARYAEAIGDTNLIYRDEGYAKKSSYGSIIAPPIFLGWPVSEPRTVRLESPFHRNVTGGTEIVYERPIYAGERLIVTSKLVDLYEKHERPGIGRMLFQIIETKYRDLNGKVVAVLRTTDITYEGSPQ